jgi:hypothetical protein
MRGLAAELYHSFTNEILYLALAARDARACYAVLALLYTHWSVFVPLGICWTHECTMPERAS